MAGWEIIRALGAMLHDDAENSAHESQLRSLVVSCVRRLRLGCLSQQTLNLA